MSGPKAAGMPSGGAWHPTVKVLIFAVILEIVAFGVLRYYTHHGG
jgi:hypothetical protein